MGPIHLPSSRGHRFILAITDYFSKWAEAIPLREVKATDVVKFIKHYVIYRYGVPRRIVHDNGHNSLAPSSPASATNSEYRASPRLLIIRPQMGSPKPSTKLSQKSSRNSSPEANATGTRN